MVELNKMVGSNPEKRHNLVPKFEHHLFPSNGMWCFIQHMSDWRYAVFPYHVKKEATYYQVFDTLEELNDSFDEVPLL